MKHRFFVITKFTSKLIIIIMILIIFIVIGMFKIYKLSNKSDEVIFELPQQEVVQKKSLERELVPYTNIPKEIEGFTVVGKIEIPKIKFETYILSETSKESLSVSVTKFYGPELNGVGNFCIVGHHYNKPTMFGKLKDVECGDIIKITDIYGQYVTYKVYDIFKVNPDEIECLNQETNGEREITLITCTATALKRLIVKAVEVYD